MKNLVDFRFFKNLVTQNHNSAFNKGFYIRQEVKCLLRLFENSYDQKYIFADFPRQFNINFFILTFSIVNLAELI